MKKIKLEIETLRVDSFPAGAAEAGSDTIPPQDVDAFGTYLMNCFYTEQASCTC